jgi:hypothetical protein
MDTARPFTLFSDFNCPFCYALHERLHGLQLVDRCAWQGVEHAPHLPVPMKPWQGSLAAELRHEVGVVRRLSPDLPLQVPVGKPNTADAIACAAEMLARDRDAGMSLVRKIYQAFWVEGRDISNQGELSRLSGTAFSRQPGAIWMATRKKWTQAWEATGQAGVPLIIAPDQELLIGCVPTEAIVKFFADHC